MAENKEARRKQSNKQIERSNEMRREQEVKPLFFTGEDLRERLRYMNEMSTEMQRLGALDQYSKTEENNQPTTHFSF